jgi:uncharacterized protein YndB with AHSA1/START domain
MTNVDIALTIVRSVDAPREIVWSAWTGPEELAGWWWPERFHTTYQVDLREGGAYRFRTIDVAGMGVLAVTGQFETFEPPEFLVYTWRWKEATISSRGSLWSSATSPAARSCISATRAYPRPRSERTTRKAGTIASTGWRDTVTVANGQANS